MTEKRFQYIRGKYSHGVHDTVKDGEYKKGYRTTYDEFDLDKLTDELNIRENKIKQLEKENEQLKKQLDDVVLNWTQKHMEFDKDELYIKDNNTEITLKGQNLFIQVFIPKIKECFKFNYIVTGRRLERGYNTLKGDVE